MFKKLTLAAVAAVALCTAMPSAHAIEITRDLSARMTAELTKSLPEAKLLKDKESLLPTFKTIYTQLQEKAKKSPETFTTSEHKLAWTIATVLNQHWRVLDALEKAAIAVGNPTGMKVTPHTHKVVVKMFDANLADETSLFMAEFNTLLFALRSGLYDDALPPAPAN